MADSRISALTRLPEAAVSPTDLLPIADLSASETKAITAKDLLEGVVINMDAGSIPASKISFAAGLPSGSLLISKGDVVLGRATGAGLAEEIACTAAGRALLAGVDAAAQRTAMGLGTLAARSGSWVDGSSFSGTSSGTNTGDQTITLTGPVTGTGTGTFATTITAGAVGSAEIAAGGVATANVADDAITALKLADQSCVVVGPTAPGGVGAFIGQGGFSTATGLAYTYTATGWVQNAGVQSVVITDASTPLSVTKTGTTDTAFNIDLDDQTANAVWAGPTTGAAAKPTFRALVSTDLPAATASARGAVYPGAGLTVAADGAASLAAATTTILGGIKVPGPDLQVSAAGDLSHPASALAPGSYVKVTTNATGHVVGGSAQLVDADITELSADKLTSGTLPPARIGPRSITRDMLNDYSSAFVQEGIPAVGVGAHPIGTFWLQESTGQISVWNGNSWMKTGASTLFNRNLRYGGTYDATTAAVTGVTQFGTAEGIAVGDLMPAGDDKIAGLYFVASAPGTSASLAGGAAMDAGDWLLCHGTSAGWVRIDTLNGAGGGGGGGSSYLDDLLDVTLTAPKTGDTLRFGASGQWVNLPANDPSLQATTTVSGIVELATVAEAEAGTDAVRAVTPAGLKAAIVKTSGGASATAPTGPSAGQVWTDTSKTPPVMNIWDGTQWVSIAPNATETARGIVELATVAEADAGTDTERAVTPAGLKSAIIKTSGGASGTAPTNPSLGQTWTDTSKSPPVVNIWDGTKWVAVGAAPPDATTAVKGIVQLADGAAVLAGTAGLVVTADQLKATNDAVATAAGGGITAINATAPVTVTGTGNTRTVAVGDATTTAKGVVQLADAAAITAGTAGLVVDAAQLKAHAPADASETAKGIVELATAAETTTGTDATRAVHPAGLKVELDKKAALDSPALTGTPTAPTAAAGTDTTQLATTAFVKAATPDASATVKGIIQLATAAEVLAGTDLVKAVTPKEVKDHYLAKNIALLPALP